MQPPPPGRYRGACGWSTNADCVCLEPCRSVLVACFPILLSSSFCSLSFTTLLIDLAMSFWTGLLSLSWPSSREKRRCGLERLQAEAAQHDQDAAAIEKARDRALEISRKALPECLVRLIDDQHLRDSNRAPAPRQADAVRFSRSCSPRHRWACCIHQAKRRIRSCTWAIFATSTMPVLVRLGCRQAMFSSIVPFTKATCCGT